MPCSGNERKIDVETVTVREGSGSFILIGSHTARRERAISDVIVDHDYEAHQKVRWDLA